VLTRLNDFSKDDAKEEKTVPPGYPLRLFDHFPPENPFRAKIPRIMREKNTPFFLKITT
jgi:hypothetical protein